MTDTDPDGSRFSRRKLLIGGGAACVGGVVGIPKAIRWLRTENRIRVVETAVRYDPPPQASGADTLVDYITNSGEVTVSTSHVDEPPLYFIKNGGDVLRIHVSAKDYTASTLLSADNAVRSPDNTIRTPDESGAIVVGGQHTSWLPTELAGGLRIVQTVDYVEEQRRPQLAVRFGSELSVAVWAGETPPGQNPDSEVTDPQVGEKVAVTLDPVSVTVETEDARQESEQQTVTVETQPTVIIRDLGTLDVVDGR